MRAKSADFLLPPQHNLHRRKFCPPADAREEIQSAPRLDAQFAGTTPSPHALNEILGQVSDQAVEAQRAIMLLNVSDEVHCEVVATLVRLRDESIEHYVLSPHSAYFEASLSNIATRSPPQNHASVLRTVVVSWGAPTESCSLAYDRLIPALEKLLSVRNVRLIVTTAAPYCLEGLLPTLRTFVFAGVDRGPPEQFGANSQWSAAPPVRHVPRALERGHDAYAPISQVTSRAVTSTLGSNSTLGIALASPAPIAIRVGPSKVKHFAVGVKNGQTTLPAGELERLIAHTLLKPRASPPPEARNGITRRIRGFVDDVQKGQDAVAAPGARLLIVGGQAGMRRTASVIIAGALPTATHDLSMFLTAAWSPPVKIGLGLVLAQLSRQYKVTGRKKCLIVEGLLSSFNEIDADLEFFRKNPGWGYRNAADFFDQVALYPHVFHVIALEKHMPSEGQRSFANTVDLSGLS